MGAYNLEYTTAASTMKEAYEDSVLRAKSEHGHNAYNGTISTTNGFIDKTTLYERLAEKHGENEGMSKWREEGWDNTEKWGEVWGTVVHAQKNKKQS